MNNNKLNPIVDATKEIVKPAYEDVIQPTAKATGKALGTVMNCFNMLLAPLERAQLSSVAKTEAFRKSLEKKYETIPEDSRQEPALKTVYQIADKLKYNLESDELREMFENLLSASMDKRKIVHPIFIDIVDKMTSEDAVLFNEMCDDIFLREMKEINIHCVSKDFTDNAISFHDHYIFLDSKNNSHLNCTTLNHNSLVHLGLLRECDNREFNLDDKDKSYFDNEIIKNNEIAEIINVCKLKYNITIRVKTSLFSSLAFHLYMAIRQIDDLDSEIKIYAVTDPK
jgi:hypothetical protein